ncbi:hypothetical protein MWU49_11625 [Alcanivorax sp. S6407]|uniref:hypothetical protein n=1 Tax=Alcanivorax sp. S6407 TaxID=2926424 RepID=UPI001FF6CDA0|nr:hypothetical protein [Alcanivorax sp. S6407]MCK0154355.1 hypothetical protein [Alcanivorax sp. S6407]
MSSESRSLWQCISTHPVLDQLSGRDSHQFLAVVSALSLGILIFHGFQHVYFAIPFQLLVMAWLVVPSLRQAGPYWFIVFLFSAASLWLTWTNADNHKYLLCYWVFALFLAFDSKDLDKTEFLRRSARYLLFFTMIMAVVQKTLAADYLDGSFFEFILMTDSRFSALAALLTGMDPALFAENREIYLRAMDPMLADQATGTLHSSAQLHSLAMAITWINYLDQIVIALVLLLPLSRRGEIAKHLLLMAFIVPVYAVAPVIGFGWLIIVWGYCLVPDSAPWLRLGYLGLFLLLCIYEFPWLSLFVYTA